MALCLFAASMAAKGQSVASSSEEFTIHYKVDRTDIDETYMDNGQQIARFRQIIAEVPVIDSITIYSISSPEGGYPRNASLAEERGAVARELIVKECAGLPGFDPSKIRVCPIPENWQGLIEIVRSEYTRHDRSKVISILEAEGIGPETRKWRLQQLDKGYTWDFIRRRYMPRLRLATWILIHGQAVVPEPVQGPVSEPEPEPVSEPEQMPDAQHEQAPEPAAELPQEPAEAAAQESATGQRLAGNTVAALRSNLLVPALNIGAEVPLGNRWSVSADYYFPWIWPSKTNRNCFELLGWSVEGRYWFGRNRTSADRLKGHSAGLYGAGGYYDFERNYEGQQGEFVSAGLDYTYAMPIGRKKRVNLEFTIAVGYIHSWGRNYNVPGEGGPLFREEGDVLFDYFGPTKAAVSLVIPFYGKEGRK